MHRNATSGKRAATMLTLGFMTIGTLASEPVGSVMIGDLQWASTSNGEDLPWAEADRHCADLTLDHHDDWRLPTLSELESIADPEAAGGIRAPITLDTCCAWSATTLAARPAEAGGDPGGPPSQYYWGFLFDSGTPYYSFRRFADGRALCVRDVE